MNTTTPLARPRQLLSGVRDEMRERRQARAYRRTLERELACYTTRSEVDDLMTMVSGQSGPDAELVRGILSRNLLEHQDRHGMAS